MQTRLLLVCGVYVSIWTAPAAASSVANRVESPDGKIVIGFSVQDKGLPAYKIDFSGKSILLESWLGLEPNFVGGFQVTETSADAHDGRARPALQVGLAGPQGDVPGGCLGSLGPPGHRHLRLELLRPPKRPARRTPSRQIPCTSRFGRLQT
jgi:hypothetical protein